MTKANSQVADAVDRFNALEIQRYYAQGMTFRNGETLALRLSDYPGVDGHTDRRYTRDYSLTFNFVVGGSVEANGWGLGLVERWKACRESPLLEETAHLAAHTGEDFIHFELVGHSGRFRVAARDFSFAMVFVSRFRQGYEPPPSNISGSGA